MGVKSSSMYNNDKSLEDIGEENGYIWSGIYIPEEVISLILSYVDNKCLVRNCRLVSQLWKNIIDNSVWKIKTGRTNPYFLQQHLALGKGKFDIPWYGYYWICEKNPFGRNLLKEAAIHKHWKYNSNKGDKWIIEDIPQGADGLPQSDDFEGQTCCFATSYDLCSKEQTINLEAEGLVPKLMDEMQPPIYVSEWHAARFDCGGVYTLHAELLDNEKKLIHREERAFHYSEVIHQWQGGSWNKVSHEFHSYGPGVRYIHFLHAGRDDQFWAGHYGPKMAGSIVKVLLQTSKSGDRDEHL